MIHRTFSNCPRRTNYSEKDTFTNHKNYALKILKFNFQLPGPLQLLIFLDKPFNPSLILCIASFIWNFYSLFGQNNTQQWLHHLQIFALFSSLVTFERSNESHVFMVHLVAISIVFISIADFCFFSLFSFSKTAKISHHQ